MTTPKPGGAAPPFERPIPIWLLVAWALTGILLAILAGVSIRRGERATRSEWESRLERLADDRLAIAERAIHEWRREADLLATAREHPRPRRPERRVSAAGRAQRAARARADLDELVREEPGMEIGIADGQGRISAASGGVLWSHPALLEPARRAVSQNRTVVAHPIREGSDALTLEIAEPILDDSGRARGAVLMAVDAADAFGKHFPRAGDRRTSACSSSCPRRTSSSSWRPSGGARPERPTGSRPPTGPPLPRRRCSRRAAPASSRTDADGASSPPPGTFRRSAGRSWSRSRRTGPSRRGAARLSGSSSGPGRSGRPRSGSAWRGTGLSGSVTTATWPSGTPAIGRCSIRPRRRSPSRSTGRSPTPTRPAFRCSPSSGRWSEFPSRPSSRPAPASR